MKTPEEWAFEWCECLGYDKHRVGCLAVEHFREAQAEARAEALEEAAVFVDTSRDVGFNAGKRIAAAIRALARRGT